jgi:hypothetical protein
MSTISLATLTAPLRGSQRIMPSVRPSRIVKVVFASASPLSVLFRWFGERGRHIIARVTACSDGGGAEERGNRVGRDVLSFAVRRSCGKLF